MKLLDQAFEAAATFRPLSEQDAANLRAKAADFAESGEYELFKTTTVFDSTAKNPEWLGEISSRTESLVAD